MTPDTVASAVTKQVVIASPSLATIAMAWLNAPLNEWSVRLGFAFLALQLLYLARKWWREEFPKRRERATRPAPLDGPS